MPADVLVRRQLARRGTTVDREDLKDIGMRAIRAVDDTPHGVYFVDFKGDTDGTPRVTEINAGRCGTTVE